MTDLSIDKIEKGIKASMNNCYSLFNDGELLFKNKRYPTSFALFQLCAEEQAKVKLLINIALHKRCKFDFTIMEKDFYNKFFSSHVDKIRYSSASDYTFNEFASSFGLKKVRSDKEIENEILNPKNLDKLKQSAFYVTLSNKNFKLPSESIDKKKSTEMRKNIRNRLAFTKSTFNHYFTRIDQFVLTYKNNYKPI